MAMILEVLDHRNGGVRTRMRLQLDALPLTVGRGYGNDLILDDPYIDARHARLALDAEGLLVLEDLGSVNGLLADGTTPTTRTAVQPGSVIRLGQTTLRFRDTNEPVPPALRDAAGGAVPGNRLMASTGARVAAVAAASVVFLASSWLGSFEPGAGSSALTALLGFLLVGAVWAGLWSVGGRIVVQRFRYFDHFALAVAIAGGLTLVFEAQDWGAFLLPDSDIPDSVAGMLLLGLVAILIIGHLAIASTMSISHCVRAGVITVVIGLGLVTAVTLVEDDSFTDVPTFSGIIKPLGARWIPTGTIEVFGSTAEDLRWHVDAMAEE